MACKRQNNVRISTRQIAAKLLINAKISLASFLCVDTFCFPNGKAQAIYARLKIIKVLPYLLITDTDSGSLEFIIIAEDSCNCGERKMKDILLKIFLDNDIHKRLNLSNEFFEQFDKRNLAVRKQVGVYEFENIKHGIVCTICVNSKEYLEVYGILFDINKKYKSVKRGTKGMNLWYEKYAAREYSRSTRRGKVPIDFRKTKTDEVRKQKGEYNHGLGGKG